MKKKKLKLSELRARSFVTKARDHALRGGELTDGLECQSSHRFFECFCRP